MTSDIALAAYIYDHMKRRLAGSEDGEGEREREREGD